MIKVHIIFKLQPGLGSPSVHIGPINNMQLDRNPDKV